MNDLNNLILLKNQIENIDKIHHIKILNILKNNNIKYSENRNGIFVNMTSFDSQTIDNIEKILSYIKTQEKSLIDVETIKDELSKDYFVNDNKDKKNNNINEYS
jgi:signal recognition particle receptor subunit beta